MEKIRGYFRDFEHSKKIIKLLAVIVILIAAFLIYTLNENKSTITLDENQSSKTKSNMEQEEVKESKDEKKENNHIYVDIGGAIKNPGVYMMESDNRIFEVVEKAGGLKSNSDVSKINQAEKLSDGDKIYIPSVGEDVSGIISKTNNGNNKEFADSTENSNSQKININKADSIALQQITGIGPSTAEKIVNYRKENGNFKSIEDLMNVNGIGQKTFNKIKGNIAI